MKYKQNGGKSVYELPSAICPAFFAMRRKAFTTKKVKNNDDTLVICSYRHGKARDVCTYR